MLLSFPVSMNNWRDKDTIFLSAYSVLATGCTVHQSENSMKRFNVLLGVTKEGRKRYNAGNGSVEKINKGWS